MNQLTSTPTDMLPRLDQRIIKQLGYEAATLSEVAEDQELICNLQDITTHGMVSGWGSFIYYHDIKNFYDENKCDIWQDLYDFAKELGESTQALFVTFKGQADAEFALFMLEDSVVDYSDDFHQLRDMLNSLVWATVERMAFRLLAELEIEY